MLQDFFLAVMRQLCTSVRPSMVWIRSQVYSAAAHEGMSFASFPRSHQTGLVGFEFSGVCGVNTLFGKWCFHLMWSSRYHEAFSHVTPEAKGRVRKYRLDVRLWEFRFRPLIVCSVTRQGKQVINCLSLWPKKRGICLASPWHACGCCEFRGCQVWDPKAFWLLVDML